MNKLDRLLLIIIGIAATVGILVLFSLFQYKKPAPEISLITECYINKHNQMFCLDSSGNFSPVKVYRSYPKGGVWENYGKRESSQKPNPVCTMETKS